MNRTAPARRQSGTNTSSTNRLSGSSWSTDKPTPSNTMSTLASSQLPSSRPISIASKPNPPVRERQPSLSMSTSPGTSFPPRNLGLGGITLLNSSVSQLANLSNSAQTLSPYARAHEHIAVRSFPHLGKGTNTAATTPAVDHGGNVKARRKRIYRLSSKKNDGRAVSGSSTPLSPDLDDSPPPASAGVFSEPTPSRKPSSSSGGWSGPAPTTGSGLGLPPPYAAHGAYQAASLTGMAQKVMRPNIGRSPDSRTSYGFPATRVGRIAE